MILPHKQSTARYVGGLALLAAVYYGAARLGSGVRVHWPERLPDVAAHRHRIRDPHSSGLSLLARRCPRRLSGQRGHCGSALGCGDRCGNTLEALVAAHLLRRVGGTRPELDELGQVRALVLRPRHSARSAAPRSVAPRSPLAGLLPVEPCARLSGGSATCSAPWWSRR